MKALGLSTPRLARFILAVSPHLPLPRGTPGPRTPQGALRAPALPQVLWSQHIEGGLRPAAFQQEAWLTALHSEAWKQGRGDMKSVLRRCYDEPWDTQPRTLFNKGRVHPTTRSTLGQSPLDLSVPSGIASATESHPTRSHSWS